MKGRPERMHALNRKKVSWARKKVRKLHRACRGEDTTRGCAPPFRLFLGRPLPPSAPKHIIALLFYGDRE